jgi:hypothetical protein
VFGLFKKSLELKAVVSDLAEDLGGVRDGIDGLASSDGTSKHPTYPSEASAFVYVLGWFAVQTSELSDSDKHRFSAELTGLWARNIRGSKNELEMLKFLQQRLAAYRQALNSGKGRDWAAKLVYHFLQYLGADSPDHVPLQGGLYATIPVSVGALRDFLSGVSRSYKFV